MSLHSLPPATVAAVSQMNELVCAALGESLEDGDLNQVKCLQSNSNLFIFVQSRSCALLFYALFRKTSTLSTP